MKIYIARQPIFNSDKLLFGYELLYRNSDDNRYVNVGEDRATRELTYNVLSEFDLYSLIKNKYGFINFDKESLMSDLPLFFDPQNIIIEILENTPMDQSLIDRIIFLKNKKYTLALDDFIDDGMYDDLLPYIDIIKVEYTMISPYKRKNIIKKYGHNRKIVAERIETKQDYINAMEDGYDLFQGYYFSKPIMLSKGKLNVASVSYNNLWNEISKGEPDINSLEQIIKVDVALTYKLLYLINKTTYYRGQEVNSVRQALVRLGLKETKKWIMLLFLCDISDKNDDEFAKLSLSRAIFMEKIMDKLNYTHMKGDAYMVGLMSLIDNILDEDILSIFNSLGLSQTIKTSFLNKNGILYDSLECLKEYELSNWYNVEKFNKNYNLDKDIIPSIYLESLKYADKIFFEFCLR